MSDYANNNPDSLMVGAGTLYFLMDDDKNGWHNLGNVSSFEIDTTPETLDKYGSMNKRRELVNDVETQISITGKLTMTEYDQYNLMLGTLGLMSEEEQKEQVITINYTPSTIPSILPIDNNGKRLMNILSYTVSPIVPTGWELRWLDVNNYGEVYDASQYHSGLKSHNLGGRIELVMGTNLTQKIKIYIMITKEPNTIGLLDGMEIVYKLNNNVYYKTFTAADGSSSTVNVGSSTNPVFSMIFTVGSDQTFGLTSQSFDTALYAQLIPPILQFDDEDFGSSEADKRAGFLRITPLSRIKENQELKVVAKIPYFKFKKLYGGVKKRAIGRLMFVGDPNVGNQLTIECHRVKILPDSTLSGLIGDDFGDYSVSLTLYADYLNNPESPFYTITYNGYANKDILGNTYSTEH